MSYKCWGFSHTLELANMKCCAIPAEQHIPQKYHAEDLEQNKHLVMDFVCTFLEQLTNHLAVL